MTIFYVLTNEAMPGLIKIGKTTRTLQDRMQELYSTGVPFPFICKYAVEVDENDEKEYEKLIHRGLSEQRANPKREFFEISFESAISLMKMIPGTDVTPKDETKSIDKDELEAIEKHSRRRPPFSFRKAKIDNGEILTFLNDESKTATVVSDREIEFNGERTSLSNSALEIRNEMGYKSASLAGTDYWQYKDETLSTRRQRIEEESYEDDVPILVEIVEAPM